MTESPQQDNVLLKYFAAFGLTLTTSLSFLLLAIHLSKWEFSGPAMDLIKDSRSTVGIIVQILSHLFAVVQINASGKLFRIA
jgi:hypothetical protein